MTVVDGKLQIVRNSMLEKGKANIVSVNEKVNASNINSKEISKANINYNQIHQKFQSWN